MEMKKLLAFFSALVMAFTIATPAFAASLSSAEQSLLNEFEQELLYWKGQAGLDQDHINQYYTEAKNALLAVDLSDSACAEFSQVIKDCHNILGTSSTRSEMYSHVNELTSTINKVGAKYYNLRVTVDAQTKNAHVYWDVNPDDGSGTTTRTVATTSGTVKQTGGPSIGQTVAVAAGALAVLAGAFVVAHKKQLFNA
jgi:hypothetical protein